MSTSPRRQAIAYRDNHPARCTVAVGILPCPGSGEHLPGRGQDSIGLRPSQDVCPDLDRLGPFRVIPQGDTGHAEDAGLLLQSPGIGQNKLGICLELQEIQVAKRFCYSNSIQGETESLDHLCRPGMHWKYNGQRELVPDSLKTLKDPF